MNSDFHNDDPPNMDHYWSMYATAKAGSVKVRLRISKVALVLAFALCGIYALGGSSAFGAAALVSGLTSMFFFNTSRTYAKDRRSGIRYEQRSVDRSKGLL